MVSVDANSSSSEASSLPNSSMLIGRGFIVDWPLSGGEKRRKCIVHNIDNGKKMSVSTRRLRLLNAQTPRIALVQLLPAMLVKARVQIEPAAAHASTAAPASAVAMSLSQGKRVKLIIRDLCEPTAGDDADSTTADEEKSMIFSSTLDKPAASIAPTYAKYIYNFRYLNKVATRFSETKVVEAAKPAEIEACVVGKPPLAAAVASSTRNSAAIAGANTSPDSTTCASSSSSKAPSSSMPTLAPPSPFKTYASTSPSKADTIAMMSYYYALSHVESLAKFYIHTNESATIIELMHEHIEDAIAPATSETETESDDESAATQRRQENKKNSDDNHEDNARADDDDLDDESLVFGVYSNEHAKYCRVRLINNANRRAVNGDNLAK